MNHGEHREHGEINCELLNCSTVQPHSILFSVLSVFSVVKPYGTR